MTEKKSTKQSESSKGKKENKMTVAIRIKGQVGVRKKVAESLKRLGLRKKYNCVVLKDTNTNQGALKNLKDCIAYGEVSEDSFKELLEKRSKVINGNEKKPSVNEIIKNFEKGKKLKEMNINPVFRLHPPRKGINSKKRYPLGVLGNHNEKINELLKRML